MLTRNDQTVEDGLEILEFIRPLGLKHLGFKDVGATPETLQRLTSAIREMGARSYLEVVSTTRDDCLRSVEAAVELRVDRLLGGTFVDETLSLLAGGATQYYPFPGRPKGHPTELFGSADDVEADCRRYIEKGCAGVDLLAYRAIETDPLEMVRASRRGIGPDKYLIAAGSVTKATQIKDLKQAGADAFTIGSAIFNGSYAGRLGHTVSQLRRVLEDCEAIAR
jgi:hypothetical protein